jgi:arabinofuranosyltransferase
VPGSAGFDLMASGQVLGVLCAAATAALTFRLALESCDGDRRAALLAGLAVSVSPPMAAWARGGMETTTFSALVAASMASHLRASRIGASRWRTSGWLFLTTLSRPEGIALAAVTIGFDVAEASYDRPSKRRLVEKALAWWPYAATLLAYLGWKTWYFGDLLPNTWYVKSGGGIAASAAGVVYVLHFAKSLGAVCWILVALPFLLDAARTRIRFAYLAASATALAVPAILVGGDYQYFWRYLVPTIPALAALAACGAVTIWDLSVSLPGRRRVAIASLVLTAWALPWMWPSLTEIRDRPWLLVRPLRFVDSDRLAKDDFVQMGRALGSAIPEGRSLAVVAVGAIGYYCDRPIVDMLGLNDRRIARLPIERERFDRWRPGHMRGSAVEVLSRRPDYVVPVMRPTVAPEDLTPSDGGYRFPFLQDLLASPEFLASYRHEPLRLVDGRWIQLYRRMPAAAQVQPGYGGDSGIPKSRVRARVASDFLTRSTMGTAPIERKTHTQPSSRSLPINRELKRS